MRTEIAVCAQEVRERPDGLIDILGVGISDVWAESFPTYAKFAVVVRLVLDDDEAASWHRLRARFLLNGRELPAVPPVPFKALHRARGVRTSVNLMFNLDVGLPAAGVLVIELLVDDNFRLPHLQLVARLGTPDARNAE